MISLFVLLSSDFIYALFFYLLVTALLSIKMFQVIVSAGGGKRANSLLAERNLFIRSMVCRKASCHILSV